MGNSTIRVLVVDDYAPWRRNTCSILQKMRGLRMVGESSDGLKAVQKAQELQPDLILLDIGLPTVNGIEAAQRIREVSPKSKILFLSAKLDQDIAEEALRTGAGGCVVKSNAASELLPAIEAVLHGKRFVTATLAGHDSSPPTKDQASAITHCHEVGFYADDLSVVDGYARFIESALEVGNVVIVVVNESHREHLLLRLKADGVGLKAAIKQGRYILLDAADAMSRLTVDDMPDPVLCARVVGDLIMGAAKGVRGKHGRVVVCGEIAPGLLAKGNAEGAIELEHMWDEITRDHGVHSLCGYVRSAFASKGSSILERICAEHSAVYGQGLSY